MTCGSLTCMKIPMRGVPPTAPRKDPFSRTRPALATAGAPVAPAPAQRPTGPRVQVGLAKPAGRGMVPGVPLSEVGYRSAGATERGLTLEQCTARGGNFARGTAGEQSYCDTGEDAGIDCWAVPTPAGCGDPNRIEGKQSTSSDWNAVGTIGAIGQGAAAILGAWSAYQTRERTADRDDQRLQLEQQRSELEQRTRLAIAELQSRGTTEAARVAADLQAQLARQSEAGLAKTALYVGGAVVVASVLGIVAYKVLGPRSNPTRGRRLYRKGGRR